MAKQSRPSVVILTRPAAQAARFAQAVMARFDPVGVISSPLLAPRFLCPDLPPRPFSALIFTSETAVEACRRFSAAQRALLPQRAYCVGRRTAQAAQGLGFAAQSADGDADALVAAILRDAPPAPLLHLHGAETRGDVAARLTAAGLETLSVETYQQVAQPLDKQTLAALQADAALVLPVFSPRTAQILAEALIVAAPRAPLHFVAISDATAAPLRRLPFASLSVAAQPDAEAMLQRMASLFAADARLEP